MPAWTGWTLWALSILGQAAIVSEAANASFPRARLALAIAILSTGACSITAVLLTRDAALGLKYQLLATGGAYLVFMLATSTGLTLDRARTPAAFLAVLPVWTLMVSQISS